MNNRTWMLMSLTCPDTNNAIANEVAAADGDNSCQGQWADFQSSTIHTHIDQQHLLSGHKRQKD